MNQPAPFSNAEDMVSGAVSSAKAKVDNLADKAASKADGALDATRRAANTALDSLHEAVEDLHDEVPGALSRAAAQADRLARKSIDLARDASSEVRTRVLRATDQTADYIKGDPLKSVLIAAATGAVLAAVIGLLARSDRR